MARLANLSDGRRDLIVIGGSAGALEAARRIVRDLPARLPAAVCIAIHTGRGSAHLMASILERSGRLPASYPADGDELLPGRIYIAPGDYHLLIEPGVIRLARGPKENGFRPAVDPLFRTAAKAYGARAVGLILSRGQNDGTLGLAAISRAGGVTVAQTPGDAIVSGMPESAIEYVDIDYVLPAAQIPALLVKLVSGSRRKPMTRRKNGKPGPKGVGRGKVDPAEAGTDLAVGVPDMAGPPSVFVCPECGGTLWEAEENGLLRYRCHVGHAFTGEALVEQHTDALEYALWTALRSLEESTALRRRMSSHARNRGLSNIAEQFDDEGDDFARRAATVRKALVVDDAATKEDALSKAVATRARRASKP